MLHPRSYYTEQQVNCLPNSTVNVATQQETDAAILKRIAILKATREREAARGIAPSDAADPSREGAASDEEE